MQLSCSIEIDGAQADVWAVISNIENSATFISGIKKVEILEQPTGPSIVGLKWQETREWMGKDAIEVMWITDASESNFYKTRAESHGSVHISGFNLDGSGNKTKLTMSFDAQPVSFGAKVIWALTGWMAKGAMKKTVTKDLDDIKIAAEKQG
jgi:carbon monoxide dehydrogenase subunit G